MASESAYQEFTGKSVEEALKIACETFKVGLADLDFEILTPGSKGVLGMGAEAARNRQRGIEGKRVLVAAGDGHEQGLDGHRTSPSVPVPIFGY